MGHLCNVGPYKRCAPEIKPAGNVSGSGIPFVQEQFSSLEGTLAR